MTALSTTKRSFYLFISLLCFFTVVWIWSVRGVQTVITVEKKDSIVSIYFDGTKIASAKEKFSERKILRIEKSDHDLDSSYFSDSTSVHPSTVNLPKENYKIGISATNPYHILLHFEGDYSYTFSLGPYRHLSATWLDDMDVLNDKQSTQVSIGILQGLKWISWTVLKPFPYVAFIAFLFFSVFQSKKIKSVPLRPILFILPIIIGLISFLWSRHLMDTYLHNVPHVPDSVEYVMLGKMIASGRLVIPLSEIPSVIPTSEYAEYFFHWYKLRDTIMFVPYHIGHPLVLAFGNILHIPNAIPPLFGSITLLLIYLFTYRITGSGLASLGAMGICFASPFFQTQTVDFMSHNTAAVYLLLSLWPLFFRHTWSYVLSGLFLGLLLNTRPLTFLPAGMIIFFWTVLQYKSHRDIGRFIVYSCQVLVGFMGPLILFLYYNYLTTGNALVSPYSYHGILGKIGLGGESFKLGYGLLHGMSNLSVFSLFFLKNYYISFGPLLLAILILPFLGGMRRTVAFLIILIGLIIGIWMLYDGNFFMYGPRFIYESVPLFAIVYGIVFFSLFTYTGNKYFTVLALMLCIMYAVSLVDFELRWFGYKRPHYLDIYFVPANVYQLKGFNSVEGKFLPLATAREGKSDTYLLRDCGFWWCVGEGVWLNSYPLNESKPLFLSLPHNSRKLIPHTEILDWTTFPDP